MTETQKKKLTVRDVVTVAAMMVIYYFLCMIPAQLTLAVPVFEHLFLRRDTGIYLRVFLPDCCESCK